jgi:UDP-glucose 6-dehydrogenase
LFYCVNDKEGYISDFTLIETFIRRLVIIKTTLQVGELEYIQGMLPGIKLVYMPEFLREATPVEDFLHPDHLVYGAVDPEYSLSADGLFVGINAPRYYMEPKAAELVKLTSNVYPLLKLVFWNQVYDLCKERGVDYDTVVAPLKKNKFNSGKYMEIWNKGGRGGGGKCLPKDLSILLNAKGMDNRLLKVARELNTEYLCHYPKKP